MIKLVRVDHRLLHGQVIFSLTKQYDIIHIIVADNQVLGDPMSVMAMTIAKP
ncbi:PTS mannose/fructose/sorbose transporter subunit IIB, partial [Enterococcus faecium]|uniref:PTS sugar transporter subunit IIB n=1 Tax=Enterococcus faecium TaxID=1352 RepID=UPI00264DA79A